MRVALCLLLASGALAAPVGQDMAMQIAQAWTQARFTAGQTFQADAAVGYPLASSPSCWLVRFQPEGFVIVAADDAMRPVIGWSDTGDCPTEVDHPGPQNYLNALSAELAYVHANNLPNTATRPEWDSILLGETPASRVEGVMPLLSCSWDQGTGWNAQCPPDAEGPGGRALVGCVAVSMGQIMHFWRQPMHGTGSHGYWSDYGYLSVDFGAAVYDWTQIHDSMPTPEAAELLYHCGVAVDMGYSATGSGAYVGWGNPCALSAMRQNFGFLPSAQFLQRESYTWAGWRNRLKQDLDAGRPIIHCGYGSGGHAWNLDGWQEGDFFHMNWGWGGSLNGWFLIDQLTPGGENFSEGQGVIVNLEPEEYQRAPLMVFPQNNAEDVACEPLLLEWDAVVGADSYELEVDDGANFNSLVASYEGLEGTSVSIPDLLHYTQYYWRIRSHGDLGTSHWSPIAGFITAYWDQTPTPIQISPMNGAVNVHLDPTILVWDFVDGAISYGVQVDDNSDFSSPLLDSLGVETNYVLLHNRLQPGTQYWWRTNCYGLAGQSAWSTARLLTTESTGLAQGGSRPDAMRLEPVWPNPFNPSTVVRFQLEQAGSASLVVFNLRGEKVVRLIDSESLAAGAHDYTWNADGLPSGTYLLVLESAGRRLVRKATLIR